MSAMDQLSSKIFPDAVKAGSFGKDVTKFISFKEDEKKEQEQFNSIVKFGDVMLEKQNGERLIQPVVIKTNKSKKGAKDPRSLYLHALFYNEVLFYSKILPSFRKYDKDGFLDTCFCEFVYGYATEGLEPEDDLVILKNLNEKGFRLSEESFFIDEKHTRLVLDRLGKFHALSLALQMDNPKRFNKIVSEIITLFAAELVGQAMIPEETFTLSLRRGMEPLRDDPKYRDKLSDLDANFEKAKKNWRKCCSPTENWTVISHGDFHKNNVMFKYDENGNPVEMAFFDFQAIKVCSPVVDTSIFLFMNVSSKVRSAYWEEFLRVYYNGLSSQLEGYQSKPSYETVELDIRKKGIYGYYIAAVLAPMVVADIDAANATDVIKLEMFDGLNEKQMKEMMRRFLSNMRERGDPKATEMLVGIVKHMLDKNYIFKT